jgi:hypothetical protein
MNSVPSPTEKQKEDSGREQAGKDGKSISKRPPVPKALILLIVLVFGWIFVGISFIIGWRMWWNSPIHPSFALFGAVAFSSVTAFAIVLTLDIVTGDNLSFEFASLKFTGTSGPVTLWILSFVAIMGTFMMGDFRGLSESSAKPCPPVHELVKSSSPCLITPAK